MPEKLPVSEKAEEDRREKDKRKAIIAAARDIFSEQGYESTTIAEIAAKAGVAVGTVYLHFHNKRDVYLATSMSWNEEIATALLKPELLILPIRQVPRAIIETIFQIFRRNNKFILLFQLDVQTQEEIERRQQSEQQISGAIAEFLRQSITRGDFQPFDIEMYAKILFGLVHSVLYDCFCIEGGANQELYCERTIEIIERIFFGPSLQG